MSLSVQQGMATARNLAAAARAAGEPIPAAAQMPHEMRSEEHVPPSRVEEVYANDAVDAWLSVAVSIRNCLRVESGQIPFMQGPNGPSSSSSSKSHK